MFSVLDLRRTSEIQLCPTSVETRGGLAQLAERVLSMHEVGDSISPFSNKTFLLSFASFVRDI